MRALQIVIGAGLIVIGVVAFLRTRHLIALLTTMEEPPPSQAHRDRIDAITWSYHLIAALTSVSGLLVVALAITG